MHGPTCIFWANLTPFSLEAGGAALPSFAAMDTNHDGVVSREEYEAAAARQAPASASGDGARAAGARAGELASPAADAESRQHKSSVPDFGPSAEALEDGIPGGIPSPSRNAPPGTLPVVRAPRNAGLALEADGGEGDLEAEMLHGLAPPQP